MPLNEIKHNIENDAHREARKIHEAALKEKEQIIEEAAKRANEIKHQIEQEIKEELRRLQEEYEANTEVSTRNVILSAREIVVEKELARIKNDLIKRLRNSERYKKIFRDAIAEATELGPSDSLTIVVNKNDSGYIGKTEATVKYENIDGGLIIYTKNEDVKIDATLDKLIESRTSDMKNLLMEEMFGSGAGKRVRKHTEKRKTEKRKKRRH